MITILSFGIAMLAGFAIFLAMQMETGSYPISSGVKVSVGLAVFVAIFYRALRRRLDHEIKQISR